MAYKKKSTTEDEVFVLILPLEPSMFQRNLLERIFRAGLMIEHHLMAEELKKLKQLERTKAWKSVNKALANIYSRLKVAKKQNDITNLETQKKELFKRRDELISSNGFSDFAFQHDVVKHRCVFRNIVHSDACAKIASHVWQTFDDYFHGKCKEIRFTPWSEFRSLSCKTNITGIRYCATDKCLIVGKEHIRIGFHHTDKYGYETEAMRRRIHFCGIIRRWYPSGWKYFSQITLGGKPPMKVDPDTGEVLYRLGKGDVGNDIGPQTLATVSNTSVSLVVLAENVEAPHAEIRRIQRAMDRSRRASNPKMFDSSGRIVPINKLPPEYLKPNGKRKWIRSKNYTRLESHLRYLYQKTALQRRQSHNQLANRLVSLGDRHYIEKMNWRALSKRRKEDKVNAQGKHTSKKRFGKSIANKAPATFVDIYQRKVEAQGGRFSEINTVSAKASQFNHMDHTYKKKKLSQRWNNLPNGDRVQRDLYSAWLIQCINRTLDGYSNYKLKKRYSSFKELHDKEIQRLKYSNRLPSSTGIKTVS